MFVEKLYCVYDIKSKMYFPPFMCENDDVADRRFGDLLVDPQSILSKHPDDYRLFLVGEFVKAAGELRPLADGQVLVSEGSSPAHRTADVARADADGELRKAAFLNMMAAGLK